MELDLTTIQARFDAVLSGECSREGASDWAREIREADDRRELEIIPETDRKRVWKALEFLQGFDLKVSPTEYLYANEDLIAHRPP